MAGYRAFANKLWNAARFVLLNAPDAAVTTELPDLPAAAELTLPDRWILSRLQGVIHATTVALETFRFDDMAAALYRFLWHEYCDWYLEMSKASLVPGAPPADAARSRAVLLHVLESVLRLLHPVMPFLTEEIWQRLPHAGESIALAPWPAADAARLDPEAERSLDLIMEVVGRVRNLRAELGLDPGQRVPLVIHAHDAGAAALLRAESRLLVTLARLSEVNETGDGGHGAGPAARAVAAGVELAVPLAGLLDLDAETRRLRREIDKLAREREGHAAKLRNPEFLARAKPEIVDKVRAIDRELGEKIDRLGRTLGGLEGGN
jgi:valyl-tRNA synthetase